MLKYIFYLDKAQVRLWLNPISLRLAPVAEKWLEALDEIKVLHEEIKKLYERLLEKQ
jgi:hypothetical protein